MRHGQVLLPARAVSPGQVYHNGIPLPSGGGVPSIATEQEKGRKEERKKKILEKETMFLAPTVIHEYLFTLLKTFFIKCFF